MQYLFEPAVALFLVWALCNTVFGHRHLIVLCVEGGAVITLLLLLLASYLT